MPQTTIYRLCFRLPLAAVTLALGAGLVAAQDPNLCDEPGEYPDVIVGDLHQVGNYGSVGQIAAFSVGTTSCNLGTCWLNWISETNEHPVIAQNMFRLKDGRFSQIGQSWLKHGFFALSGSLCATPGNSCQSTNGDHLGVNCSDPYSSGLNGQQSNLGPKFEVNASTGDFSFPFSFQGQTGNSIFKRLQVHHDDLDPALNPGAIYFIEGQYVTKDDAAAGRDTNNASYRRINVSPSGGSYSISLAATTQRTKPAIQAWQDQHPAVVLRRASADGRFLIGALVTDLGDGRWQYEYAVQNLTSHRSAGSFTVRLPWGANVSDVSFHDVDYHSGEPFDDTDWEVTHDDFSLTWATTPYDVNPEANALRWGTLYNFGFVADVPPATGDVELGLFRPGTPATAGTGGVPVPSVCDQDGICDPGEDCTSCAADCVAGGGAACCGDSVCDAAEDSCSCVADCGPPPVEEFLCADAADDDCDQLADCADSDCCFDAGCGGGDADGDNFQACDCDDGDSDVWFTPDVVEDLVAGHDAGSGQTTLSWTPPVDTGATEVTYETVRSANPINFLTSADCVVAGDATATSVVDAAVPPVGTAFYYVTRAVNGCPQGEGSIGRTSENVLREGRSCP